MKLDVVLGIVGFPGVQCLGLVLPYIPYVDTA
jgi:hypothetical protein